MAKLKKLRVAVLMGGPSSEHDVSLKTGANVLAGLDRRRYAPEGVVVSRSGRWPMSLRELVLRFDLAFIGMHGEYGEDGTVQTLLARYGIPFTGSGPAASAIGMDKVRSAARLRGAGLAVPPFVAVRRGTPIPTRAGALGSPLVVKPASLGSSVGVSIVPSDRFLPGTVRRCLELTGQAVGRSPVAIVQRCIRGTELTCGVVEVGGELTALPVIEIVPKRPFFDYAAKYDHALCDEIVPARIPKSVARAVQQAALAAHRAIGAAGYSRTDFILENFKLKTEDARRRRIWVLEVNTLPGLTEASLLPKAAAAAGISFPNLLDDIIEAAFRRR